MNRIRDFASLKAALRERGFKPKSSLGQNFLLSPGVLKDIVKHADIQPGESVVEIGVGGGSLTGFLLEAGAKVLGVEIDRKLLGVTWQQYRNVGDHLRLLNLNVLGRGKVLSDEFKQELLALKAAGGWKLVANLPYNISTPVFIEIMSSAIRPSAAVVLVQKDFAERVVAHPGCRDRSPVSVLAETFGKANMVRNVASNMFWPTPGVESAVVKWVADPAKPAPVDEQFYIRLVSLLFSNRRKQLGNVLKSLEKNAPELVPSSEGFFEGTGIDQTLRAEQLQVGDFLKACEFLGRPRQQP